MLRALLVTAWVTVGFCGGLLAQRIYPPGQTGPRPNVVPNPKAKAKIEAGPLFPESTPLVPPAPDPILAAHDLNVGKFYYNRGDFVGALARFDDAIYHDPASAEAYCRAGDTLWKMRRDPPARTEWRRCLEAAHGSKWAAHAQQQLRKHKEVAPAA